jgi:pyruvate dehydrogenase E2 component (dihydrolipoamide acetyltransferase)
VSAGTGTRTATGEQVFRLPDLGEGLTEAEVIEWRVAEGDVVEVDQVVVEVETAKATVEVPCPYAGRVVALHASPGDVHSVGLPLITVAAADGTDEPAGHATYREEERAGSGAVLIGYGTGHGAGRRRRARTARGQQSTQAPPAAPERPAASRVISPIVRRLARERGLDVADLRGTGAGGVVTRADVEAGGTPQPTPAPAPQPAPGQAGETRVPLTGVRKAIADKLSRSRREIPEATVWVDVDATGLLEARAAMNAADPEHPVSVLALLARICVQGLARHPELNARVDTEREEIVRSTAVHLGLAAQTERGLVVPVVRDAHAMSTRQLAQAVAATTAAAREGTLAPAATSGSTFTLNNYGVFGVDGSTPIINHPEAAIVGLGRIVDKPWVVDGRLEVRKVTQVVLAFDHRVCDGGTAGGFLRYVADCIERPAVLLADL